MLAANGLWEGLSPEEVETVEKSCNDRLYPKDTTIYFPGEATNALFIVKKGLVKLSHIDDVGEETIIRIFAPGDVFGEIFLGVKRQLFASTALTDSEITVIPRQVFENLLTKIPQIGVNFISLLSRRLAEAEARIGEFSHTWAHERLERVLLNLSKVHGRETRRGRQIDIHLTHQLLADIIGASRETVSRHLKRLEELGALMREGRRLTINHKTLFALQEEKTGHKR